MNRDARHIILALCALVAITACAQRPRLRSAVAVTYDYATEYRQHGVGAKLRLGLDSHWRLEPELIYFAESRKVTTLQLNAHIHYVEHLGGPVLLYPFAGVSYSHWGYEGPNVNRWGANLGAGLELNIGRGWAVVGEFRFMLVKQETQAITTVGLSHSF